MNETPTPQPIEALSTSEPVESEVTQQGNAYPFLRRLFLVLTVLVILGILLFLLYINGRSLYTYGL